MENEEPKAYKLTIGDREYYFGAVPGRKQKQVCEITNGGVTFKTIAIIRDWEPFEHILKELSGPIIGIRFDELTLNDKTKIEDN